MHCPVSQIVTACLSAPFDCVAQVSRALSSHLRLWAHVFVRRRIRVHMHIHKLRRSMIHNLAEHARKPADTPASNQHADLSMMATAICTHAMQKIPPACWHL
jgi:hypothetical protein